MLRKLITLLAMISVVSLFQTASAQDAAGDAMVESTKNDFLVVISGGLGGAILGLSTLSFVEEPKDHTNNILVGASLGIIAGVAVVAYMQAEKSSTMFYGEEAAFKYDPSKFNTVARNSWHSESFSSNLIPSNNLEVLGWSSRF